MERMTRNEFIKTLALLGITISVPFELASDTTLDEDASKVISALEKLRIVSDNEKVCINSTVKALKINGTWDMLDSLYINADNYISTINWKNPIKNILVSQDNTKPQRL